MKCLNSKLASTIVVALTLIAFASVANAIEPTVVTFDNGTEGWTANPDCETIEAAGPDGAYWNFANRICDGNFVVRAWFKVWNDNDPAFVGDYTAKGPVRISVDVNVNDYTFHGFFGGFPAEESRQLVVELIDWDNPYTDPDTGYSWPWTSVLYPAGYFQNRDAGWKTFEIDIEDPNATEVPEGWVGFGGPENPTTYMPQLPPDRTFADLMAEIDDIQFHTIEPGYFYSIGFTHDIDFDNITIRELPQECQGQEATVYVGYDGIVRGGELDGQVYAGQLTGTQGDDIIVGTAGDDSMQGLHGHDLMCGKAGNDAMHGNHGDDVMFGDEGDDVLTGQQGTDFLSGGEGRDIINGGPDSDTCVQADIFKLCGQ